VCTIPLAMVVRDSKAPAAYLAGFLGFLLHGMLAAHWMRFVGAWLFTGVGFGVYGLLFTFLARACSRRGAAASVWLPLAWTTVEHLRGTLFFCALPWVYLAHAVFPTPMVQAADLGGQGLVSFAVAAASGILIDLWDILQNRAPVPAGSTRLRLILRRGAMPLALLIALHVYGSIRPATIALQEGPRVLAVQSNLPQEIKDATSHLREKSGLTRQYDRLGIMRELSILGAATGPVALIVWPETIIPVDSAEEQSGLPYAAVDRSPALQRWFENLERETGAPILGGSQHAELRNNIPVEHNSLFLVQQGGRVTGRYDKIRLAPVGERTPFADTVPALYHWIRETFVPPGFREYEPGLQPAPLEVGDFKLAGSICFELSFPHVSRASVLAGAQAVVNVSNYAWFRGSSQLDLARAQTRFRAIEVRRAFVSVVNGGITHFVDARGAITDLVVPGNRRRQVEGFLLRPLQTAEEITLFLRTGPVFAWAVVLLTFGLAGVYTLRSQNRRQL
jgi:apolipoprotein N-acyltransferase